MRIFHKDFVVLWISIAAHLVYAFVILSYGHKVEVTGITWIQELLGAKGAAVAFATMAVMTIPGMLRLRFGRDLHTQHIGILLMLPQLFTIVWGAVESINCAWRGQFADGVVHAGEFIFMGQVFYIAVGVAILLKIVKLSRGDD